jgi:aminoglycoside phosphotransferase (APT) family kinase protein
VTKLAAASPEQIGMLLRTARPGWRLVRTWTLPGATSTQVSAIEAEQPDGQRRKLVLRQYGAANLRADPCAAETEYRLLELLSAAGLPVPRPYLADSSGAIVPGPCLLQEFIDGERADDPADTADSARQLAGALAALHGTDFTRSDVPFLSDVRDDVARQLGTGPADPDEFLHENAVRAAVTGSWPPPELNRPVILHGDYWPGNVLWRHGRLAGVIDWEDALFGDPLADLSITRLEISWSWGFAAMSQFTDQYLKLRPEVDAADLALWDLRAALRASGFKMDTWGLPAEKLATARAAHREFIERALHEFARRHASEKGRTRR